MKPKRAKSEMGSPLCHLPKRFANTASFFCRCWRPLGAVSPPFGPLFAHSGSFLGFLWRLLGHKSEGEALQNLRNGSQGQGNRKPPRTCRDSAEDCREPAKNCREPSQNPPRTCRTNLKQKQIHVTASTNRLRSPTDAPIKRLEQKWGGGAPPWGDFN